MASGAAAEWDSDEVSGEAGTLGSNCKHTEPSVLINRRAFPLHGLKLPHYFPASSPARFPTSIGKSSRSAHSVQDPT
jgi:hypothetical protein